MSGEGATVTISSRRRRSEGAVSGVRGDGVLEVDGEAASG
jgi:hypothetical protein